jgi:GAF domain-containing protein
MRSSAFKQTEEFNQIVTQTCQSAVMAFEADHCAVVTFSVDFVEGLVVAEFPTDWRTVGQVIPVRGVLAEEALISSKIPLFFPQVEGEDQLGRVADILKKFSITTILIVPIVVDSWVIGSFSLDFRTKRDPFSAAQLEQCVGYAAQVSLALRSAKKVNELKLLRQTTLMMTQEMSSYDKLFDLISRQSVALLDGRSGGIYKYFREKKQLHLVHNYSRDISGASLRLQPDLKLGEGIAGRLIESGLPFIIVDDSMNWEGQASRVGNEQPSASVLQVPLTWKENITGVIYVEDTVKRQFTPEDASFLKLLADHAAVAINQLEMQANVAEKLRQLEKLAKYSPDLIGNLTKISLDERLNLIAQYVTEIINSETCGIFLYDTPQMIRLEASYGHRTGYFEKHRPYVVQTGIGTGLTGDVAARGVTFMAHGDDLKNNPAVKKISVHTPSGECYSLLMMPLNKDIDGKPVPTGWIRVDNKRNKEGIAGHDIHFTQSDIWILSLFAEMVRAAIEASQLVEDLNTRGSYLNWLVGSWQGLNQLSTEAEVVQHIAEQALLRLGVDFVAIWSFNQASQEFEVGSICGRTMTVGAITHFHELRPRTKGTAYYVLDQGWIGIPDITDLQISYMGEDTRKFLMTLGVQSFQGAALKTQSETLGVIYADYKQKPGISEENKKNFKEVAAHAALVLESALTRVRLLDRLKRTQTAIRIITQTSLTTDLDKILQVVADAIKQSLPADAVTCYAYDQDAAEVLFPPGVAGLDNLTPVMSISDLHDNSIIHHVIHDLPLEEFKRETHDAQHEPWMASDFVRRAGFVTSICYRLLVQKRVVGVLFINYGKEHIFSLDEYEVMLMFANQAAVAIDNALRNKAERAQHNQVVYQTLQNWLSMLSSDWSHEIAKRVTNISLEVKALYKIIEEGEVNTAYNKLEKIERILGEMKAERLTLPLSNESGIEPVLIHDLVLERLTQLWSREPYRNFKLKTDFRLSPAAVVRISPDWMKYVIDTLVDNAIKAMRHQSEKRLVVSTKQIDRYAHITFSDKGSGMPENIQRSLFKEQVFKPILENVRGNGGIPALITRVIVEAYNGKISLDESGENGTQVTIKLPLES